MTAPITAVALVYTVQLNVDGAPSLPMPYSRVKGRRYQPDRVALTYQRYPADGPWRVTATVSGLMCRKDGSVGEQHTEATVTQGEFPEWLTALAAEYRPVGVA